MTHRQGFTLMELLVVISIIGVLAGMLMPALSRAKERARRVECVNNLKQLGVGSLLYADEDSGGNFSATVWKGDRNFNWLYPQHVPAAKTFLCPSTRNFIRSNRGLHSRTYEAGLEDLFNLAGDRAEKPGTSYVLTGFMGGGLY
ncbi:MAG: prepilin-type N-terminal cleavage/methylation domain-containing protein [Verrucomicrobia bacterium]|nr:prepilin-type N-terminal cleavage/methylation domain-containing protein [Verrucomicrobiota bacterium]